MLKFTHEELATALSVIGNILFQVILSKFVVLAACDINVNVPLFATFLMGHVRASMRIP